MGSQVVNGGKLGEVAQKTIHHHFSKIASRYHHLRTTDSEPIILIAQDLNKLSHIEAADIGCGSGRYDALLFKYLGDKLHLSCVDASGDMLKRLDTYLKKHGISNFKSISSRAESLPFPNNNLDCICTFNAVHHFNLLGFLRESARVLKKGGYLFIYTRLPEQNMRNIWGQYFPEFCKKEDRLHTLDKFMKEILAVSALRLKSIEYFKYKRISILEQLIERVRANHYSTFWLYSSEELEEAIAGFIQNIRANFKDIDNVSWFDENIMLVLRKEG